MRCQFRNNALILPIFLLCLLFATPAAGIAAQDAIPSEIIAKSIVDIEKSISRLQPLVENAEKISHADSEALTFRLDQGIIRLIADVAKLARHTISTQHSPDQSQHTKWKRGEDTPRSLFGFDGLIHFDGAIDAVL